MWVRGRRQHFAAVDHLLQALPGLLPPVTIMVTGGLIPTAFRIAYLIGGCYDTCIGLRSAHYTGLKQGLKQV